MTKSFKRSGTSFAIIMLLAGCGSPSPSFEPMSLMRNPGQNPQQNPQANLGPGSGSGESSNPGEPSDVATCGQNSFTQPTATSGLGPTDFVVVTDSSWPFLYKREDAGEVIGNFMLELSLDYDYRMGVILGHGSCSDWFGRLYSYDDAPPFLRSGEPGSVLNAWWLYNDVAFEPVDDRAQGGREMLASLTRWLERESGKRHGFLRKHATTSVIFIPGGDDLCSSGDPKYAKDCAGLTPASVVSALKAAKPDESVSVAEIVPHTGGQFRGIDDVVTAAGGTRFQVGASGLDKAFFAWGTGGSVTLRTAFPLSDFANVDPSTVVVLVDGKPVASTFDPTTGTVTIGAASAGMAGSKVTIDWCDKPTPVASPAPNPYPTTPAPYPTTPAPNPIGV